MCDGEIGCFYSSANRNTENRLDSATSPRTRRPASAALSRTSSRGARPIQEKRPASPAHMHSERCDIPAEA